MFSLRARRVLRCTWLFLVALGAAPQAHDLEKTQVSIVFARDGTFVAEVANDPAWLKLRQESIPGPFADRVVFWVDGHEIRPESVSFDSLSLAQGRADTLAVHRLRGRVPLDAQTLRWFYGLVIDPYPLTVRPADGRLIVEAVQGNAWSRTIDLAGQFHAPLVNQTTIGRAVGLLLRVAVAIRFGTRGRVNTKDTKDTEEKTRTA